MYRSYRQLGIQYHRFLDGKNRSREWDAKLRDEYHTMRNHLFSLSVYSPAPLPVAARRQAGFSLVELMIAITLGLVVLLAVGSIYMGSRQTYRVQEDNARMQEAADMRWK